MIKYSSSANNSLIHLKRIIREVESIIGIKGYQNERYKSHDEKGTYYFDKKKIRKTQIIFLSEIERGLPVKESK